MHWIQLAQDTVLWRAIVNRAVNLLVTRIFWRHGWLHFSNSSKVSFHVIITGYCLNCRRMFRVPSACCRLRLKCDGTRAETRFSPSAKRTSPFKSAGALVQSTTGSRVVRISRSNAGCTTFRGSVKGTDYPPHSPVSPSLPLPCVTLCHHVSTGPYPLSWVYLEVLKSKFFTTICLAEGDVCTYSSV
jgi:hypothetical protein